MSGTGFGPEVVAAVLTRDGSVCAMWGANPKCERKAQTANHRMNRQMGGSRYRNGMGNACAICDWCNGAIEDLPELAELARHRGVKLRSGATPSLEPLWHPLFGQWVQITDHALYLLGLRDPSQKPTLIAREGYDEAEVGPILTPDEERPPRLREQTGDHDRPALEGVDVNSIPKPTVTPAGDD